MLEWLYGFIGKHERMLMKAERRLERVIESKSERNALDASKFVAETVGKKIYSKRVEQEVNDPRRDRELELLEKIAGKK